MGALDTNHGLGVCRSRKRRGKGEWYIFAGRFEVLDRSSLGFTGTEGLILLLRSTPTGAPGHPMVRTFHGTIGRQPRDRHDPVEIEDRQQFDRGHNLATPRTLRDTSGLQDDRVIKHSTSPGVCKLLAREVPRYRAHPQFYAERPDWLCAYNSKSTNSRFDSMQPSRCEPHRQRPLSATPHVASVPRPGFGLPC